MVGNDYRLNAAPYIRLPDFSRKGFEVFKLGELLQPSGKERVGESALPIMSITMNDGLIDQGRKFKKRIASADISTYRKAYRNELVVGFPIDEGVLGFQTKYPAAAVSPAYKIWRLVRDDIDPAFLEIVLRSLRMRETYKLLMQGAVDRRRSIPDDMFLRIPVPIPSKATQQKIVEKHRAAEEYKTKIKSLETAVQEDIGKLWG